MIRKTLLIALTVSVMMSAMLTLHAEDKFNSSTNPADIAEPVPSMIELGSTNSSIYDTVITVLEVIRGKDAERLLKKAGAKTKKPEKGSEYLLAKIKFELNGRAVTDTMSMKLGDTPLQWVALTSELTDYVPVNVKIPEPALAGEIKAGEIKEGWVVFTVEKKDTRPVMVFNPDSGGATGRGRTLFFKLY